MWNKMTQATDGFSRILGYLSGFAIMLIGMIQIVEIICRNFFDVSISMVWEVAGYLHVGAIFIGAAFALRTGGHIRVTLLKGLLPRIYEGISTTVGLCLSICLSYSIVQLFWGYLTTGRTSGTVNDIPLMYPAGVMAFGSLFLTFQLILRLIQFFRKEQVEIERGGSQAE